MCFSFFFMRCFYFFFFFFSSRRRHTRSLRDWSSDVCSSDLVFMLFWRARAASGESSAPGRRVLCHARTSPGVANELGPIISFATPSYTLRSEERRVGKEWRCRWVADHEKKKVNGVRD